MMGIKMSLIKCHDIRELSGGRRSSGFDSVISAEGGCKQVLEAVLQVSRAVNVERLCGRKTDESDYWYNLYTVCTCSAKKF